MENILLITSNYSEKSNKLTNLIKSITQFDFMKLTGIKILSIDNKKIRDRVLNSGLGITTVPTLIIFKNDTVEKFESKDCFDWVKEIIVNYMKLNSTLPQQTNQRIPNNFNSLHNQARPPNQVQPVVNHPPPVVNHPPPTQVQPVVNHHPPVVNHHPPTQVQPVVNHPPPTQVQPSMDRKEQIRIMNEKIERSNNPRSTTPISSITEGMEEKGEYNLNNRKISKGIKEPSGKVDVMTLAQSMQKERDKEFDEGNKRMF